MMARIDRLQQRGAQGRRQGQREEGREQDGHGHRQAELFVNDADRAAGKGHGNEHRGQHQRNADHRAGNLLHGFDGCVAG